MPIAQGYAGIAKETVFGTPVAPSTFLPVKSIEVSTDPSFYYPEEIRSSRAKSKGIPMGQKHEGSLEMDAEPSTLGLLLLGALGSVSTTNVTGVYTHVFTPANTLPSFTVEKYDTVQAQRIAGCKIDTLTLSAEAGGDGSLVAEADFKAQSVADQAAPATPAYTDKLPFTFTNVTVTKGGATNENVTSFSVEISNGLKDDQYTLRKSRDVKQIAEGMREVTGSVAMLFKTKADHTAFMAGTKDSLKIKFEGALISGATYESVEIELPKIQYDSFEVPMGSGDDDVIAEMEFTALLDSTAGFDVKATLVNAVVSY